MTARGKVWLVGLVAAASLAGWLARDADSRELSIPAALLTLAACALVAEGVTWQATARRRGRPEIPPGARPADGVVDLLPVTGIEAVANPVDPRWRRFTRTIDGGPRPAVVRDLSPGHPALLGRVALISVFVGRDGNPWTDREIARAHEALERAGLWIEREAVRWDARVNIGLADAHFRVEDDAIDPVEIEFAPEGDDFGPMEAHASTKAVIGASRAAALLGFADVVDLLGRINPRVEADARVWLFHPRRAGRSLAVPAAECDVSGVGLALCYAREASFPEPLLGPGRVDPTTVAHELMHLFGASDKYGTSLRSYPAGSVTSRDVMRLNHDTLSRMTIDLLTASEIGWGTGKPELSTKNARR